jgi:pimeloyl-ACP methyl ester carboxylesterase
MKLRRNLSATFAAGIMLAAPALVVGQTRTPTSVKIGYAPVHGLKMFYQLNIERADFVGYSMGGAIAVEFANRHPALVRKLVFVGGTSYPDGLYSQSWRFSARRRGDMLPGI